MRWLPGAPRAHPSPAACCCTAALLGDRDMDMSAAELQAVVESTADIAAQAGVVQSSRRRGAEAALGTSSRGRGRGRGRPKGKAAAAAPVTEDKAVGAVATAEAASAEQEQAGTLPQALVDQVGALSHGRRVECGSLITGQRCWHCCRQGADGGGSSSLPEISA